VNRGTYVEINETGSAVIAGTRIHVEAVAHAYAGGYSEQQILDWLKINRVQFHGALAYYYEHQDEIKKRIDERTKDIAENDTLAILRQRKNDTK
jgi:uncharacterized protein (DUF433 family)